MSFLKALRKKVKTLKQSRPAGTSYNVPLGWKEILQKDDDILLYKGVHHHYTGHHLDKETEAKVLGCRDMVLSYLTAFSRIPEASDAEVMALAIFELFSDTAGAKLPPERYSVYVHLKPGLPILLTDLEFNNDDYENVDYLKGVITADFKSLVMRARNKRPDPDLTRAEVDDIILFCSRFLTEQDIKGEYEAWIMTALMSLVKGVNASDVYVDRRVSRAESTKKFPKIFLKKITPEIVKSVWLKFKQNIDDKTTVPENLVTNFRKITNEIDNVSITPLVDQIAYTNLTALVMIAQTISQAADFPWDGLFFRIPAAKVEFELFKDLISVFDKDKFIGMAITGCSRHFSNLAYLSIQLQISAFGNQTLVRYRGVGSKSNSPGINQGYYDGLIKRYIEDTEKKAGDYASLKAENVDSDDFINIASAIQKYFNESLDDGDDDDDEDNSGNPNPPRSKSPPRFTSPPPSAPPEDPSMRMEVDARGAQIPPRLYPSLPQETQSPKRKSTSESSSYPKSPRLVTIAFSDEFLDQHVHPDDVYYQVTFIELSQEDRQVLKEVSTSAIQQEHVNLALGFDSLYGCPHMTTKILLPWNGGIEIKLPLATQGSDLYDIVMSSAPVRDRLKTLRTYGPDFEKLGRMTEYFDDLFSGGYILVPKLEHMGFKGISAQSPRQ